jgi:SAM-dependent methyltransferase
LSECRNCGGSVLEDLGPIGLVAAFFLKRALGLELRYPRSANPLKQKIRALATRGHSLLSRLAGKEAFVEMQVCSTCSFIQTKTPFHEEDVMRLYRDYRSPSYNQERIQYEPSYASIAAAVGQDELEVRNRRAALTAFLHETVSGMKAPTLLDYGGSDGRFIPEFPGAKFVYEVSDIQPVPGVIRIESEAALKRYSIVLLAHVIEHVPNPLKLVRTIASYVEPGGYLYIETPQEIPDAKRESLRRGALKFDVYIHEHINSYCVPAVSRLFESAGLDVVKIESARVDVGWGEGVHIRALGQKKSVS